jgi:hypothetical protein
MGTSELYVLVLNGDWVGVNPPLADKSRFYLQPLKAIKQENKFMFRNRKINFKDQIKPSVMRLCYGCNSANC